MENDQTHQKILKLLQGHHFTQLAHEPTKTSEESAKVRGVSLDSGAKAMLLKNKKSDEYILCVMSASKKLSWKLIRQIHSKHLDLANEEQGYQVTQCLSGAVPPFGSIFQTKTYMDTSLMNQETINFNAGLRTQSIGLRLQDYLLIEKPQIVTICE